MNNSIWARVTAMMAEDDQRAGYTPPVPEYLRCVDYLTFKKLGEILLDLLEKVFPEVAPNNEQMKGLSERWRESVSKVRRLRNQAAHLRNISFQDMGDLVGTIEAMRRNLIDHTDWRK